MKTTLKEGGEGLSDLNHYFKQICKEKETNKQL